MASASSRREWRESWTLVVAASVGFSFFSVMMAASGLFMEPLGKEFGWSRALLSSGPSVATVMTAILGPFFGAMIDRFGPRRLALPGIALTMASVCAFSLVGGSSWQWLFVWFGFGLVSVSIKSTIWTTAVVRAFASSRGLALGLTLSGAAVAQSVVPPLAYFLIDSFGWRGAFVWLGLGWGGVTLLLAALFFREAKPAAPASLPGDNAPPTPTTAEGLTVREAMRSPALVKLAVSNFIVMAVTMGLTIHLVPILTEAGVSRRNASLLAALSGISGIAGKLLTGYLLDRYRPQRVSGITLGAAALAFALLIDDLTSPALIVVALLVNGYAAGTKTHITGYLTAEYSGMKNFGAIYGFMSALMALASGVGPLLAGISYDRSGGYEPFLYGGAAACLLGGMLMLTLPPAPDWKK